MPGPTYFVGSAELHAAALAGDLEAFRAALASGADVNGLDREGSTVLMCAIAGTNWRVLDASDASFMTASRLRIIQTIIEHPDVSLYTLNAPHAAMNGVTPLGMASWLNYPSVVRSLIEESQGTVTVNGADSSGVTALMYAARDGSLEVASILIANGARPDFRDGNYRTSIQFALPHPQMLWLCENALRRHRHRETLNPERCRLARTPSFLPLLPSSIYSEFERPPSLGNFANDTMDRLTNSLIRAIVAVDLRALQSLLFPAPLSPPTLAASLTLPRTPTVAEPSPRNSTISLSWPSPPSFLPPVLVNRHDKQGWAPIHHCAAAPYPSVMVLDALYCAGADVSLFTAKENYSPLHCFARYALLCNPATDDIYHTSDAAQHLYKFALHLVRDLQSPLSARDKDGETPLHIAAEHGTCIDVLAVLLDLDETRQVRELRNSRGYTPIEVARPEFRGAFGAEFDALRPRSSLSTRTVRALHSATSLSSMASLPDRTPTPTAKTDRAAPDSKNNDSRIPALTRGDAISATHKLLVNLRMPALSCASLVDTARLARAIMKHHRTRLEDAADSIDALRASVARARTSKLRVESLVEGELTRRGLEAAPLPPSLREGRNRYRDSEDSQLTMVSTYEECKVDSLLKDQCNKQEDTMSLAPDNASAESGQSFVVVAYNVMDGAEPGDIPYSSQDTHVFRRRRLFKRKRADTATRFSNWIRRKAKVEDGTSVPSPCPELDASLSIVTDAEPEHPDDGIDGEEYSMNLDSDSPPLCQADLSPIDAFLCSANILLATVAKDLRGIEQSLDTAELFLQSASASLSRAERVIDRTLMKRKAALVFPSQPSSPPSSFPSPDASSSPINSRSPSYLSPAWPADEAPLFTIPASARSSSVSLATAALPDPEEGQDTRVIRRLLLRKIDAGFEGAFGEIDRVSTWLPLTREAVIHIKRRCYL